MSDHPLGDDRVTDQIPRLTEGVLDALDHDTSHLVHKPVLVDCYHDGRVDLNPVKSVVAKQYLAYANDFGAIVLIPVREPSTDELHAQVPTRIIGQMERFFDAAQSTERLYSRRAHWSGS